MKRHMIFHHPLPIISEGKSGSQVHAFRMAEAFEQLGYQVEFVTGYAAQRKQAIEEIKKKIFKGWKFDFMYSESSTTPTALTEKHHFPTHPFLDFSFFKWLRKHSIPLGLFYGDVYWRFEQFKTLIPWHQLVVTVPFYWYDWLNYLRLVDHLFLPSLAMRNALPSKWPNDKLSPLFPGCLIKRSSNEKTSLDRIRLFYVGGIVPPLYDLRATIEVIKNLDNVLFTICCRKTEWEKVRSYYQQAVDDDKIQIVHSSGQELESYYADADLFILTRASHIYLDFSMPVKLFESLGFGVPVITNEGTEAARFVTQEDIGWVVSTSDELRDLLRYLQDNPQLIIEKQKHIETVREHHTWLSRAQMVVDTLTS